VTVVENSEFSGSKAVALFPEASTTGVYTYPLPTVTMINSPSFCLHTTRLVSITRDSVTSSTAVAFANDCTQPCNVVNIDSTANTGVVKFKVEYLVGQNVAHIS